MVLWSDSIVSSTVFEREISCQHVDVNMRMLRFFSVEKPGIIPRWGQSVSDRDFHTCLFFPYDILYYHRPIDSPSDYIACEAPACGASKRTELLKCISKVCVSLYTQV